MALTRRSVFPISIAIVAVFATWCARPVDAGVNAWTTTGPYGGWTVAADPLRSDRVLAASDRGVYVSTDGARHWNAVPSVGAPFNCYNGTRLPFVFDARSPGRVYTACWSRPQRSDDGGASWVGINFPGHAFSVYMYFDAANVWRIEASPHRDAHVYASDGALAYSTDAGTTWTEVVSPSFVYDFALDPALPDTIVVANHLDTVARSIDNGATWTSLKGNLPPGLAGVRLAIDPSAPDNIYLVAAPRKNVNVDYAFASYALYVTHDGGRTWAPMGEAIPATVPWWETRWVTAPARAGMVFLHAGERLLRSEDFGATWASVTLRYGDVVRSVAVGPNGNDLYASGVAGVQRSRDGGRTWEAANAGLPGVRVGQVEPLAGDEFTLLASTGVADGNGNWLLRLGNTENSWLPSLHRRAEAGIGVFGNDDGKFLSVRNNGTYAVGPMAVSPEPGVAFAIGFGVERSPDHGATWESLSPQQGAARIAVSPADGNTLYLCGARISTQYFYSPGAIGRSRDEGRTWTLHPIGAGTTSCSALATDPTHTEVAYVTAWRGDGNVGELRRTSDGGGSWIPYPPLPGCCGHILSIAISSDLNRQIVVAGPFGSRIYRIVGNNQEWISHGDLLPIDVDVRTIAVDWSATPPMLYAGTDMGVYRTPMHPANGPWILLPGSEALSVRDLKLARPPGVADRLTMIAATDAGVHQFTDDPLEALVPVHRLYNARTRSHFYTASRAERDHALAIWPHFIDEGTAFRALATDAPKALPVFRFYNMRNGAHFYTASTAERDAVFASNPDLAFEGIAFYGFGSSEPGTVKLHRLYHTEAGDHFYTTEDEERDSVRLQIPQYVDEGIACNVYPAGPDR